MWNKKKNGTVTKPTIKKNKLNLKNKWSVSYVYGKLMYLEY